MAPQSQAMFRKLRVCADFMNRPRLAILPILVLLVGLSPLATAPAHGEETGCLRNPDWDAECIADVFEHDPYGMRAHSLNTFAGILASYRSALAALSPAGQDLLRQGQQDWRAMVALRCGSHPHREWCLGQELQRREQDLKSAALAVGGYVFSRIDLCIVGSEPGSTSPDKPGWPVTIRISYPRIDSPASPEIAAWNEAQATEAMRDAIASNRERESGPPAAPMPSRLSVATTEAWFRRNAAPGVDWSTDYVIRVPSERLVSIEIWQGYYTHDAPHGWTSKHVARNLLLPEGRWLTAADLLAPETAWVEYIVKRFAAAKEWASATGYSVDRLSEIVRQPENWVMDPDRLRIITGAYPELVQPPTFTWRELAPYLRGDAPVPLQ